MTERESTPRDVPIIFSAPMVRALFEGRKTMTRRLAQSQRKRKNASDPRGWNYIWIPSPWQKVKIGDRVWVRENWRPVGDGPLSETTEAADFMFYATASEAEVAIHKWRPSIHMPRWASRLTLLVTGTKIERVQDISDDDVFLEGLLPWGGFEEGRRVFHSAVPGHEHEGDIAPGIFGDLWTHLHGKESWDANPEVVALSFEVRKLNIDQIREATRKPL